MEALNIIIDSVKSILQGLLGHLPQLAAGGLVLVLTWFVAKAVHKGWSKIVARFKVRKTLEELFRKLVFIAIWLTGILITGIIVFPGLTPAKLLTVVGLSSVAIGFAFKDIFENFMAGILILVREPFEIHDFIECQEIEGIVEEITIRDTHIRQTDGQRVVLPNAMLFKNPVYVRTDQPYRRTTIICGVAYGEDVDKSREVIRKAVTGCDGVNGDKPIQIFAQEFASSSINFEVTWWTGSKPVDIRTSRDQVVAAVKSALDAAGIEIPFPYRTLTFKEELKVHDSTSEKNGEPHSTKKEEKTKA